ncbi:hypothetical protein [Mesorhizobium sp. M1423]|uniref:hypothetical protein n=1 Tax=Mesorhizobium sp. M1423 TaxID=2957101 RepID=UPI00333A620D
MTRTASTASIAASRHSTPGWLASRERTRPAVYPRPDRSRRGHSRRLLRPRARRDPAKQRTARLRTGGRPDPTLLIGQLAVDHRHAGQGVGSGLVKDALHRCVAGADIVGGRAVVVRAIDAEAERYW